MFYPLRGGCRIDASDVRRRNHERCVNYFTLIRNIRSPVQRAKTQMSLRKAQQLRNLRRRLAAPAKQNGKLQRSVRRALHALTEVSTSEAMEWAFAMKIHAGDRLARWDCPSTRRALEAIGAVRVGRAPTIGRPWIWRLKDETSPTNDDESKA